MLSQAVDDLRARRESGDLVGMSPQDVADMVSDQVDESISSSLAPDPGVALDLGIPAGLPSEYIPDLPARMGLYQRLIALKDEGAITAMEDELRDRFGPLPWQARALLYTVRLRILSDRAGIESITRDGVHDASCIVLRMKQDKRISACDVGGGGFSRRALIHRRLPRGVEVGNAARFGSYLSIAEFLTACVEDASIYKCEVDVLATRLASTDFRRAQLEMDPPGPGTR